jgi:hypothetical protein
MDTECKVIEVISPCLTSSNVATIAKLAKQIPDGVRYLTITGFLLFFLSE